MTWCVITKVPDPEKGEDGNLYHITDLFIEHQNRWWANSKTGTTVRPYIDKTMWYWHRVNRALLGGMFMTPVFTRGEVLWLDENGRDPIGRKPTKWFVEVEYFTSPEDAIERSKQVRW